MTPNDQFLATMRNQPRWLMSACDALFGNELSLDGDHLTNGKHMRIPLTTMRDWLTTARAQAEAATTKNANMCYIIFNAALEALKGL
jgi:hypothetical protein